MTLKVTFELAEADLDHFRTIMREARELALERGKEEVLTAADGLLARVHAAEVPDFVRDRLIRIQTLIDMLRDAEWQLPEVETGRVLNALAYFSEPEDLIPDHVPGLGFLDDAIMVELVVRELRHEIDAYLDFCTFRTTEEARRQRIGKQEDRVTREQWLASRRKALHSRMRSRRRADRERRHRPGSRSPFSLF